MPRSRRELQNFRVVGNRLHDRTGNYTCSNIIHLNLAEATNVSVASAMHRFCR